MKTNQLKIAFNRLINDTPACQKIGLTRQQIYNYKQPKRQTEKAMLQLLWKAGKLKLTCHS